jgi:phosphatidylglycerophosphatase A
MVLVLARAGGAGYAPIAPGTFGSMVGVLLFVLLVPAGPGPLLIAAAVLLAVGIWASDEAERIFGQKDDGRIVIDEVVGQLLALAPLAALAASLRPRHPLLLLAGFLCFRLFDIWKPGPARLAERSFPGGLGVMLDDVVAGLFAAAAVAAIALAAIELGALGAPAAAAAGRGAPA